MEWKDLIYDGRNFGSKFKINENGEIKNIKTNNITKQKMEGSKIYCMIYFDKKTCRIPVGDAQVDSGHNRTILDKANKPLSSFTARQELEIRDILHEWLLEINDVIDIKIENALTNRIRE